MVKKKKGSSILVGKLAFTLALILALITGFTGITGTLQVVLVALGIIIGLLNITAKEVTTYLVAVLALAYSATALKVIAPTIIWTILSAVVYVVASAALIVALVTIFKIAAK